MSWSKYGRLDDKHDLVQDSAVFDKIALDHAISFSSRP